METIINPVMTLNNNIIWGLPMVILMLSVGFFLIIITDGVLFRRFGTMIRCTLFTLFRIDKNESGKNGSITPFQAVCTALAATVGTGNIIGVALAITTGGPGAVFWLWISALVGIVLKYSEVTLSVAYRSVNQKGDIVGGPMYYIEQGMGIKWLAIVFAVLGMLASFGIGASVQANSLTSAISTSFHTQPESISFLAAFLAGLVLIGGIRRIASVTEILVPFMAVFYIVGAVIVLIINASEIPAAFALIFHDAFNGTSAVGGFAGASVMYACRIGMARGVFTHEAGMGSAPIAHASANTDHPARQGMWGAFEVFFDSIIMCTITALVVLTSGLWCTENTIIKSSLCSAAFKQVLPGGEYIITVSLSLFAFATIIAWYYYGEKCVEYLFNSHRMTILFYRLIYILMVYLGGIAKLDTVWELADLFNGLMAVPNLVALIVLSPVIRKLSRDFFANPPSSHM